MKRMSIIEKHQCCGCGVCANVCGTGAIKMVEDSNGFLYPDIHPDKCIQCGACEQHCPILAHEKLILQTHHIKNYAAYLQDGKELRKTASGGAASALSKAVLQNGGVVFGVAYDDHYRRAKTIKVQSLEELELIRDSKYMQSDKKDIYREVKRELQSGRMVLFTGTPCEIGAVKAYLMKEYENLYTCEIICHGPTSYQVAESYLAYQEKKQRSKVKKMSVRSKDNGWRVPHIKVEFENGKALLQEFYSSDYGIGFTVLLREACHECLYKGDGKVADITVGDFWGADEHAEFWNPDGISAINVHTEKGERLLQMANTLRVFPVEYEAILKNNSFLEESELRNRVTPMFGKGIRTIGLHKTASLYTAYRRLLNILRKR